MPFLVFGHLCLLGSSDRLLEAVFMSARFSLTASVSQETLYLVLGFVGIHFDAASRCASTKFSYSSFGVPFSVFSCSASNLFLNSNAYLSLISLLSSGPSHSAWLSLFVWRFFVGLVVLWL